MRIVVQKVTRASVRAEGKEIGAVNAGLLVLLGIEDADTDEDINWLTRKLIQLRIFNDEQGVMNRSVLDVDGDIMVISQFTLHASTKKGNRPSYIRASGPGFAEPMYNKFIQKTESILGKKVAKGKFGAVMEVSLVNDGPVTIIMDSKQKDF